MNDIKIRAWDKIKKVMVYDGDETWEPKAYPVLVTNKGISYCIKKQYKSDNDWEYDLNHWQDIELMLCLGIKDKNDKDIFKGDIIKMYGGFVMEYIAEVDDPILGDFMYIDVKEALADSEDMEVIGNIYQNPELLEGKNG